MFAVEGGSRSVRGGSSVVAVAAMVVGLLSAVDARASEGHVDALVFQNGGKVRMGGIDVECFLNLGAPGCDPNGNLDKVYEAELLETGVSPGLVGEADEPGFFSVPDSGVGNLPYGDNLPGNAGHTMELIQAPAGSPVSASILFWDGTGPVSWSTVQNGEFFDLVGNNASGGTLDGSNYVLGIELDSTAANGSFDSHPDYFLNGNGGTADPTVGFYTVFGRTRIDGLEVSNPWAAVFDWGVEDEVLHEAAIENVATFIPEPATGALLGLGLLGLARRRHRRSGA